MTLSREQGPVTETCENQEAMYVLVVMKTATQALRPGSDGASLTATGQSPHPAGPLSRLPSTFRARHHQLSRQSHSSWDPVSL